MTPAHKALNQLQIETCHEIKETVNVLQAVLTKTLQELYQTEAALHLACHNLANQYDDIGFIHVPPSLAGYHYSAFEHEGGLDAHQIKFKLINAVIMPVDGAP